MCLEDQEALIQSFCFTLTVTELRQISQRVSFSWGYYTIFRPNLGVLLNVLRNVEHFLDILHECPNITLVVTKLRNVLGSPLLLTFSGCIWSIRYYVPQKVENQQIFPSEFFLLNFCFWPPFYVGSYKIADFCLSIHPSVRHLWVGSLVIFFFFFLHGSR